jgi:hypothetical protein
MYWAILETSILLGLFASLDKLITRSKWNNPYYAVHAIHNAAIVYTTAPDIYHTFTDLHGLAKYDTNWFAVQLCVALHLYHIALYYQKFRFDDWLHHLLMIGVALPVGCYVEAHTFMGFSLFFTTGLPGGIDYFLLFLVRNGYLNKYAEKDINASLNVWIRSPGTVAMAALSMASFLSQPSTDPLITTLSVIPPLLNYWNGQYFMQQVVEDHARIGCVDLGRR